MKGTQIIKDKQRSAGNTFTFFIALVNPFIHSFIHSQGRTERAAHAPSMGVVEASFPRNLSCG